MPATCLLPACFVFSRMHACRLLLPRLDKACFFVLIVLYFIILHNVPHIASYSHHPKHPLQAQSLSASLAEAQGKEAAWEAERVRTQKALEQAAEEIRRLRERQERERAAMAGGQRAVAEASAAWEAEREEVCV